MPASIGADGSTIQINQLNHIIFLLRAAQGTKYLISKALIIQSSTSLNLQTPKLK